MGTNDLIAISGIAVTLVVSTANLIYSLRNNKRTMFVNTVTTARLKWIDSLRDKVSEFIAVTARLSATPSPEDLPALLLQRDTLLHQIALHLNPLDPTDVAIRELVDYVRELTRRNSMPAELDAALVRLRDTTGTYLKKEWNRVKEESEGKPLKAN